MRIEQTMTRQELLAELGFEELNQLVGLVSFNLSTDPFPVTGRDAVEWVGPGGTPGPTFA
ncbi:hypothetical protein Aple_082520 [Acrocarpospora pleiomorpha]|uniref:Uncharacterized protein n=1 Tax=Acrocarpospora pleiomorpha TaxID=90975 RepID=A0A5M3Y0R4_9ACTN|nr:hypothetical protein [Acrocarpospora pleiomorpha]GES25353.1 hypothetical protein Aple_082520 [Acrocarpospora pleiomorpha]